MFWCRENFPYGFKGAERALRAERAGLRVDPHE
jgi:hypothetical protein